MFPDFSQLEVLGRELTEFMVLMKSSIETIKTEIAAIREDVNFLILELEGMREETKQKAIIEEVAEIVAEEVAEVAEVVAEVVAEEVAEEVSEEVAEEVAEITEIPETEEVTQEEISEEAAIIPAIVEHDKKTRYFV